MDKKRMFLLKKWSAKSVFTPNLIASSGAHFMQMLQVPAK